MYLEKAKALYAQSNIGSVCGCSENAVQAAEKVLGRRLPEAFREFLHWMGGGGEMWVGSDWGYRMVIDPSWTTETRQDLKEKGSAAVLPEDALIFWMHGGYQFRFIRLGEGDNPPVYYYHDAFVDEERTEDFEQQAPHFSEWLENMILGYARLKEEQSKPRPRPSISNLARGKKDVELQEKLEAPEHASQIAAALQELQEKLQRQGQGLLMQVIDQSKELVKRGVLKGLEAWMVTTAPLSEEEVLKETLFLHKINQSRMN